MYYHKILVIGGGLAGLRAAIESAPKVDTAIISQVHPVRSHSGAAQGGVNASFANNPAAKDDNWEKHAFDTVKGSDYLADQDSVEFMTKEAVPCIVEMEHWGCPVLEDRRWQDRSEAIRRCRLSEDMLRDRQDRSVHAPHSLGALGQARHPTLRGPDQWSMSCSRATPCRGVICWNMKTGELETVHGRGGHIRHAAGAARSTAGRRTP